jgi:EAL domain-containing protein (putative c-di-GMP-specific phosphodiesterase class I)
LAEATNLIAPITDLVLSHSIATCATWAAAGHDLSVAVNVSDSVLTRDGFVDKLIQLLAQHRVPPTSLTLEITESIAIRTAWLTMEVLSRLRLRGLNLALDDFGTGYSNLSALDRLPVNELKIDKSVITRVSESRNFQIIAQAVAGLAQQLGLVTVAEGVEHVETCRWLASIGIEQVQGFGIGRPMPASEILSWIGGRSGLSFR